MAMATDPYSTTHKLSSFHRAYNTMLPLKPHITRQITSTKPINARSFGQHRVVPWIKPHHTHEDRSIKSAAILPGQTADTQLFSCGSLQSEVPVTAVQKLPELAQAGIFLAIFAGLGLGTYALCSFTDLEWTRSSSAPYIFGITFTAAGVAHFTAHDAFCTMMPQKGAWGLWYLPGSDSFHVNWTGVAEIAGGVGLLASTFPAVNSALPWLQTSSALGLFLLSVAVTPSNIFMATHNAPGPGPKDAVIPLPGHIFRGIMQIVLWTALWGLSHP